MIIDGRAIADNLLEDLKQKIHALPRPPKLTVVLVGDNPASLSYIWQKRKYASRVDMEFELRQLPIETSEQELLSVIQELNADKVVNGFLIQLPLPAHIDTARVVEALDPKKDVDGFTSENIGKLFLGTADLLSCTPKGIMKMLEHEKVDVRGRQVTIIGRSNLVGKPLSLLMINAGATVTVCNSRTKDIWAYTRVSDVVIVAAGSPGLLKADMITPGSVVIDVGCNMIDNKWCGDSEFAEIEKIASISPVPGGVGPMTVAMLIENTYIAAKNQMQ